MLEIDIEIDLLNSNKAILFVLKQLKPEWSPQRIHFQEITGGLINRLLCCFDHQFPNDKILVKIYGRNSEFVINHENAMRIQQYLSACGLIRPLLASFRNGMVFTYTEGSTISPEETVAPPIRTKIAALLAKFHRLHPPGMVCEPSLWQVMDNCVKQIPIRYPNEGVQKRYELVMPPKDRLVSEIAWVRGQCEPLASPVVFCHNDLSQSNVLFDPPTQRLAFIDFELCQYNYQAIDFAHLFSFKVFEQNEDQFRIEYATDDQLREFFSEYLFYLDDGDYTSERVNLLLKHTRHFQLADHLFQCVWALQQVVHSSINYDYLQFARNQLDIYYKAKISILNYK